MIALLLLTLGLRAWKLDQPIVENYVGRQIPTAMVARNLDRSWRFHSPELDTGPFPNLFLVEPPLYAATVVVLRRLTGLTLEEAGRLTSALATVLG
ncbi:ArnT family glycosyltransferase, partial [Singulisphaera rosea]